MKVFQKKEVTTPSSSTLFCAPMAGVTHSAFRRLLSDFGGYSAIYTELLAGRQMVHEDAEKSPYLKRRAEEGKVIYQLLLTGQDAIPRIMDSVLRLNPAAIDINCGCGGKYVRQAGGGVALFENRENLKKVITEVRREYAGPLMLKIRLGRDVPDWQKPFLERIRIIEDGGADAITLHPRFAGQHMKRGAKHELFSWLADNTRLPVIANGDILGPVTIARNPRHFEKTAGIMVGRMAIICPWLFSAWDNPSLEVDHLKTWLTFYDYLLEDFRETEALGPLKLFTKYYAQNFSFGHTLYTATRSAPTVQSLREHAIRFMSAQPAMMAPPTLPVIY